MILDETDSGLDIDALRIVSEGVNAMRSPERSMLVITHYQRLLDYIRPDRVHVLAGGRIVASGGPELALELEAKGYDQYAEGRRMSLMQAIRARDASLLPAAGMRPGAIATCAARSRAIPESSPLGPPRPRTMAPLGEVAADDEIIVVNGRADGRDFPGDGRIAAHPAPAHSSRAPITPCTKAPWRLNWSPAPT